MGKTVAPPLLLAGGSLPRRSFYCYHYCRPHGFCQEFSLNLPGKGEDSGQGLALTKKKWYTMVYKGLFCLLKAGVSVKNAFFTSGFCGSYCFAEAILPGRSSADSQ